MFFDSSCLAKQFKMNGVSIKKRNQRYKQDKPIKPNFRCPLLELCSWLTSLMLIVIETSPCVVSRRKTCRSLKLFVYKYHFFPHFPLLFHFFRSQSWFWELTVAIFRQSAIYVSFFKKFFKFCYYLLYLSLSLLFTSFMARPIGCWLLSYLFAKSVSEVVANLLLSLMLSLIIIHDRFHLVQLRNIWVYLVVLSLNIKDEFHIF